MNKPIELTISENLLNYERLCKNLVEAIEFFLQQANIPFLRVYYRIKDINSIQEKIQRKGYNNPLDQIEDICGIRIICYYSSDIKKIEDILSKELNILEQQNKAEALGAKEFGYRSNHYIITIKNTWTSTPNYRKLENYKVEIQLRTVLMHAWAEIEHKLNYKNEQQVPEVFKRKLYRLSAKFEEADEQFEDIKNNITNYVSEVTQVIEESKSENIPLDFNLETLKSFINFKKGDYVYRERTNSYFDFFNKNGIGFKEIDKAAEFAIANDKEIISKLNLHGYAPTNGFDFGEILFFSLDILYPDFLAERKPNIEWSNAIEDFKKAHRKK